MEKDHTNQNPNKAGVAIVLSGKIKKTGIRTWALHNDVVVHPPRGYNTVNITEPIIGTPTYIKQILMDLKKQQF